MCAFESLFQRRNKFALFWGEAQLCLPYVCFKKVVVLVGGNQLNFNVSSRQKLKFSSLLVTFKDLSVTFTFEWPLPELTKVGNESVRLWGWEKAIVFLLCCQVIHQSHNFYFYVFWNFSHSLVSVAQLCPCWWWLWCLCPVFTSV